MSRVMGDRLLWPFARPLRPARLIARTNRFLARAIADDRAIWLHVPSTGRLGELLVPGRTVWFLPQPTAKTEGRLVAAGEDRGALLGVDAHLAETVAERFFLPGVERRGVSFGGQRFDFQLADGTLVEVKAVTLYAGGRAWFPDAPTLRGARQVERMVADAERQRFLLLFVCLGGEAEGVFLHRAHDRRFAEAVSAAAAKGVRVAGCYVRLSAAGVVALGTLPVFPDAEAAFPDGR